MRAAAIVTAAALAGCASYAPLESHRVVKLSLRSGDGTAAICVNARPVVVASARYDDGTLRHSWTGEGSKRGKLHLSDLQVTASFGVIDDLGGVHVPRDDLGWIDRDLTVRARLRDRPVTAALTLTPRFDCGGLANYAGEPGAMGASGAAGGRGGPGPTVTVALGRIDTRRNGRLVLVRVQREGARPDYYVVDLRRASGRFAISASGGRGGAGGQGWPGMNGSHGMDGMSGSPGAPCQDGGRGGDGSAGGNGGPGGGGGTGGDGGAGGTIVVEYAADDADLVKQIDYVVDGGAGGEAGEGGPGGSGGSGGRGGSGGMAGSTFASGERHCSATSGMSGSSGRDGSDGLSGPRGQPGVSGRPGNVQATAVDAAQLWAPEIASALPIVVRPAP